MKSPLVCWMLLFVLLFLIVPAHSTAAPLPGFSESLYVGGLDNPTSMAFAPDGRIFVTEDNGRLRVIQGGTLLPTPFLTVSTDVSGERGLLGVAFDPNFTTNNYLYVYYTVPGSPAHNRVSRFTANGNVAVPGSELILLELEDLSALLHNAGTLHFGADGMLYIVVGDNTVLGNSQSLSTQLGKMLRINPAGYPNIIPPDNPFVGVPGAKETIWAYGLRNPFKFAVQPGTGTIFINDVGGSQYEEINRGIAGANYGWHTSEGPNVKPGQTAPIYYYAHSGAVEDSGCAITGGAFYNPPNVQFPESYVGDYFFTDFCNNWIKSYDVATGIATTFITNTLGTGIVDLQIGPDGALYYLTRNADGIYRVEYSTSAPPAITQHPQNQTVTVGQSASFTCGASGTPPLSYQWQRNSVNISGASSSTYTLASAALSDNNAMFRCIVTNNFGNATSNAARLTVTENTPPVATITSPAHNTLYSGGQSFTYSGTGTDGEDGNLPASAFTWRIDLHHDAHTHPFLTSTSGITGGTFTIPTSGETSDNVWYRIHLTVRDSGGLTHSVFHDIVPRKVTLTIQTNPSGLQVNVDGNNLTTPASFLSVVGIERTLTATSPQTLNGTSYTFQSWSDGGSSAHTIFTPTVNTTYTATFAADSTEPEIEVAQGTTPITDGTTTAFNFGSTPQGTAITRTFTIRNIGSASLNVSALSLPAGFSLVGAFPSTIAASGNATFDVRCNATTTGTFSGTLQFTNNDSNENPFNFPISCTVNPVGATPEISVSTVGATISDGMTTPLNFGTTPQGTPITRVFTIRNTGSATLNLSNLMLPAGFIRVGTFPDAVAAGSTGRMDIRCTATSAGTFSGTLQFTNNDTDENPFDFPISCTVTPAGTVPEIEVTQGSTAITDGTTTAFNFGSTPQGTAITRTFTIRNIGTANLNVSSLSLPAGFSLVGAFPTTIAASSSATFDVQCEATSAGTFSGTLQFTNNDSNENPFNFPISCTVTGVETVPEIEVTQGSTAITDGTASVFNFGTTTQGTAITRTFTIGNIGNASLNVSSLSLPAGFSLVGAFPTTIAASGSATFDVRCDATTTGTFSGTLQFTNNDADENPFNFPITCTVNPVGAAPEISVSVVGAQISDGMTTPLDFGTTPQGTPITRVFTIRNTGNAALNLSTLVLPNGFVQIGTFPSTVAAGGAGRMDIRCTATNAGTFSGMVQFDTNDADENPFNFPIRCTVTPVDPAPEISVSRLGTLIPDGGTTPYSFGTTSQGTPVTHVFTLRNSGTATLTLSNLTLPEGFIRVGTFPTSIAANSTGRMDIRCTATSAGTFSGTLQFDTNDADENPYNFPITCTVTGSATTLQGGAPLASAGPDETYIDADGDGVEAFPLDGSGSRDSDGTIVRYVWTLNGAVLSTEVKPVLTLPIGVHELTLTVTDNAGNTHSDTVKITVQGAAACTMTVQGVSDGQTLSGTVYVQATFSGSTLPTRVDFTLTGPDGSTYTHSELDSPYYFLGDDNGTPHGWNTAIYPAGNYLLTVKSYQGQVVCSMQTFRLNIR